MDRSMFLPQTFLIFLPHPFPISPPHTISSSSFPSCTPPTSWEKLLCGCLLVNSLWLHPAFYFYCIGEILPCCMSQDPWGGVLMQHHRSWTSCAYPSDPEGPCLSQCSASPPFPRGHKVSIPRRALSGHRQPCLGFSRAHMGGEQTASG